jgi:hypothetical protein
MDHFCAWFKCIAHLILCGISPIKNPFHSAKGKGTLSS